MTDLVYDNRKVGLLVALTAITAGLIFSYALYYLRYSALLEFKKWDVGTVTTADFTAQVTFTQGMWDKWQEAKARSEEPAKTLKAYVKKAMTEQCLACPAALPGHEHDDIKISTVFFAYANGEIIRLLK